MKTKISNIALCLLLSMNVFSQDIVFFRNGNEMIVKVSEITNSEIKYKKMDNLNGPSYSIVQKDVFMIKYENGTKDVFNTQSSETKEIVSKNEEKSPKPEIRHYGGPRLGLTWVGPGAIEDDLSAQGKGNMFSQFGWQLETRLFTTEKGLSGLFEFVPLISMVDMGKVTPSITAIIGIRGKEGKEIGVGPSISLYNDSKDNFQTRVGMIIAAGISFKSGKTCFPINIAVEPSVYKKGTTKVYDANTGENTNVSYSYKTGVKVTLLIGFNSRTS